MTGPAEVVFDGEWAGGGDRLMSETKYTKEQAQFLSKWYKVCSGS